MQSAPILRYHVLSSVSCLSLLHYPTSRKWHIFENEKVYWTQNLFFDFLYNFCLIVGEIQLDIIINAYRSLYKIPFFLSDFNQTRKFSTDFRKIPKDDISWKPLQWKPSCSVWMDGRTDMTKLIVVFHIFSKAPKKKFLLTAITWHRAVTCGDLL